MLQIVQKGEFLDFRKRYQIRIFLPLLPLALPPHSLRQCLVYAYLACIALNWFGNIVCLCIRIVCAECVRLKYTTCSICHEFKRDMYESLFGPIHKYTYISLLGSIFIFVFFFRFSSFFLFFSLTRSVVFAFIFFCNKTN